MTAVYDENACVLLNPAVGGLENAPGCTIIRERFDARLGPDNRRVRRVAGAWRCGSLKQTCCYLVLPYVVYVYVQFCSLGRHSVLPQKGLLHCCTSFAPRRCCSPRHYVACARSHHGLSVPRPHLIISVVFFLPFFCRGPDFIKNAAVPYLGRTGRFPCSQRGTATR